MSLSDGSCESILRGSDWSRVKISSSFFGQANRHEVGERQFFKRSIGGRQLALTAVDDDEIRKRPALFQQAAEAPQDHLVHRGDVVRRRRFLWRSESGATRPRRPLVSAAKTPIRYFRYSPGLMRPSSQTTIDATVSLP